MAEQPKQLSDEQQSNELGQPSVASTSRSYLLQIVAVVGVIAITAVVTLWVSRDSERPGVEILIPPPAPVTFQVSGAVVRPGVYSLEGEPRIDDAIDAAGGFTTDADTELINRALRVRDGSKVAVPFVDSITRNNAGTTDAGDSGAIASDSSDSAGADVGPTSADAEISNTGPIDLNTATKDQLITLPGVGEVRADSIIEWRANNLITTVSDLLAISGIGPSTVDSIRDYVTQQ